MASRRSPVAKVIVASVALLLDASLAVLAPTGPAHAAAPPWPLLWQREYVPPGGPVPEDEWRQIIYPQCAEDIDRGTQSNGISGPGVPKIAVVGDSTEVQMRRPALRDTQIRWEYATHCGENFSSVVSDGRLADAVNTDPDALVFGLGSNSLAYVWAVDRSRLPLIIADLDRMLDASDSARCRVLVNLPMAAPPWVTGSTLDDWMWLTDQINRAMAFEALFRPNLHVADWQSRIAWFPQAYLQDGQHHTPTGINERLNLEIETARQCWAPDSPTNVHASAVDRGATIWWDPLPGPERATQYRVTASPGGRSVLTTQPTVNIGGLTNGVPYSFQVEAISAAGTSEPSSPSLPITPDAAGSRFHASAPIRILDTRSGIGGKATRFGPGETVQLGLGAAVPTGASAVVLNVTATGQTEETFVTVWPGEQSRPLSSNLNPRPGIQAVPALVTTRVGPNNTIRLFNNTGAVDLVVDVVGWYGAVGDASGSLFSPLTPKRVLDTRDGTGGKSTKFGAGQTYALPLTAAAGVPAGATAVVVNLTATNTQAATHVTVWPNGQPRPVASNLNPQPSLTRANLTVAALGAGQSIALYNHAGATDVVVDVVGYFTAAGAPTGGSEFYPVTPERAFDTRDGTGGVNGRLTSSVTLPFDGRGVIPPDAIGVDTNVTATEQTGGGHLTVWPTGVGRPLASNLNYGAADVTANRVVTRLVGGSADVAPTGGATHLVVDVAGWFGSPH